MAQVSSRYSDHFGLRSCIPDSVRYVSNFCMNGSSSSRYSDHCGRVCCVVVPDLGSLRFEFSFMNCSTFEPILGSFWSHATRSRFGFATFELFHEWLKFRAGSFWSRMLRGCSRFGFATFEFSFMNGSSFEPILGSFWSRMLHGCSRFGFATFRI